jgi:para-nitrobenzyl esterase
MRSALLLPLAALAAGLAISCSSKETEPNVLVDPIKIDTGYISGTIIGDTSKEVRIYRGIPYAAPPVGDLRWKPPQVASGWTGIRECTVFGKSAPQADVPIHPTDMPQSEDCLYLNVLTPARKASDKLPVMVWLHGGAYFAGSGGTLLYNSPRLTQNGVVLVTTNMRLGPLGLLAHPRLSNESPDGVSGNYMFLDMIAALEWVQRNIAAFGGDSENVTIFGQSGGGYKVSCLVASPMAKGLFQKAICMSGVSGTNFPGRPMKDLAVMGEKFFAKLGVDKDPDPLKAARALPWEKIMESERILSKELNEDWGLWDSAIDGHFLMEAPANIFRSGNQNSVPVIASATLGEIKGPGWQLLPSLVPDYVNMLHGANKAGEKGYVCIFDQVPGTWRQEGCVSPHAMDLGYAFGDWDNSAQWWPFFYDLQAKDSGAKTRDPGLTDMDRKVSENMMAMWAQFARSGDPNVEGLVNWPAYDSETDQYLYIAEPLQIKIGFSEVGQKE